METSRSRTQTNELIGRNLAAIRQARGLSLAKLSRMIDNEGVIIDRAGINKIEHNQRRMTVDEAVAICTVLDVDLRDMVTRFLTPKLTIS